MGKVGLSVVGAYELGARLSTSSCLKRLEESACWALVKTGRPPWRRRRTIEHAYGWKIIVFLVDLNFMSMCLMWSGLCGEFGKYVFRETEYDVERKLCDPHLSPHR
jgi:hypothetical protein